MSWKDHYVVVAAIAATSTAAFFVTTVNPLVTSSLKSRIENAELKRAELESEISKLKDDISNLNVKLKANQTDLTTSTKSLEQAQFANLFRPGDPLPEGFRMVHVGDPASVVLSVYPLKSVDQKNPGYYAVDIDHPVFTATYVFDDTKTNPLIARIDFNVKFDNPKPLSDGFLNRRLVETFGLPTEIRRDGSASWTVTKSVSIFSNGWSMQVLPKEYVPGWWPKH